MAIRLPPKGTRGTMMPRWFWGLMRHLNVPVYRLLARRGLGGLPLLLLTTVGAKSGQLRRSTLGAFPEGDDAWLVVGSMGGAAEHPAWVHNMAKYPDQVWIEIEGRRLKVAPTLLTGPAWDEAWAQVVARAPNYGRYQDKTDRHIPIIRLTLAREPAQPPAG
jgi:deazaflavin-dependent oxidoreductase (nitroreductase family)